MTGPFGNPPIGTTNVESIAIRTKKQITVLKKHIQSTLNTATAESTDNSPFLLQEDGFALLQEDGSHILL